MSCKGRFSLLKSQRILNIFRLSILVCNLQSAIPRALHLLRPPPRSKKCFVQCDWRGSSDGKGPRALSPSPRLTLNFTVVKVEISPWCCRNFTTVAFPLHHGGVLTAPRWSFYGTMVEWHRHRGVFPDFTMVKKFLHHGVFSKKGGEMISPWWRLFRKGVGTKKRTMQKGWLSHGSF